MYGNQLNAAKSPFYSSDVCPFAVLIKIFIPHIHIWKRYIDERKVSEGRSQGQDRESPHLLDHTRFIRSGNSGSVTTT